ncbi:MAG: oxidoreductase molybdopterin binding [Ilumatobacteraceae bacterium]|nr:oxidoreductase molybdopterin binding [Ilumatobacteraceae bacterium]
MSTSDSEHPAGDAAEPQRSDKTAPRADARKLMAEIKAAEAAAVHHPPRWWGALVGIVAAGSGLAVGEFVAGFSRNLRSPVVSVGDRVIDHVPKWMKDFAIRNFGTSDKVVLIWTILAVIAIAAVLVGIATVRGRRTVGIAFATAFGLFGALCSGFGRNTHISGIFPSLVAAAVAGGVLLWGAQLAQPRPVPVVPRPRQAKAAPPVLVVDRRRFLATGGALALGAMCVGVIGRNLQDRFNSAIERAGVRPPTAKQPLPAPPADPSLDADNKGLAALITPINNFYRIDTAISFPSVSLASWRLKVTGLVDKPLSLSFDDIMSRELIERDITISCVSNEVGGDLVGNARWVGCRLDDLLREAGIQSSADQVMGESVDGFTAGFPVSLLDGRDAMIAIGMNGEALPVKNGFPARIIVPGIYGYVSAVKWLSEIRLTRFADEEGYWIPRGWSALGPIKTQSRIDRPGGRLSAGATHIAGVAWAPTRGISKVEVQVDDADWLPATLGPVLSENTWVQWWVKWDAPSGKHQIRVRATDGNGDLQTDHPADVAPDGATGWHTIRVTVA